jgi:hypothetical protein
MRSLLASARAFSAFFALATADLLDFSAVVLAAAAASKACLEALSSASRDDMRALAADKAFAAQRGETKLEQRNRKRRLRQAKHRKEDYLEKL